MLLLTGATGLVGSALLRRLIAEGTPVRCLVRDPRRLGAQRVRVQIALGDLTDPPSFRNAMRGVHTVVHLAASIRDQPRGSIEELNGIATWRMVRAAQRAGVERFVFFSVLGASTASSGAARGRLPGTGVSPFQRSNVASKRSMYCRCVSSCRAYSSKATAAITRKPATAAAGSRSRPRAPSDRMETTNASVSTSG